MFTSSLKVNECHNTSLLHHLTSIAKLNPSHSRLQNYNSFAMTFINKLTQSSINNKKVLRRLVKRFWLWWFFLLQKFFFFFVFFQQFITSALNVFWTRLPIVRELCAPVTKRDFQKLIIVLFNPKAFYNKPYLLKFICVAFSNSRKNILLFPVIMVSYFNSFIDRKIHVHF